MIPRVLPKPIDAPLMGHVRQGFATPPELVELVVQLLREDVPVKQISAQTGVSKTTVAKIRRERGLKPTHVRASRGTGLFPSRISPTHCTGETDCGCVYHKAEAWKQTKGAGR